MKQKIVFISGLSYSGSTLTDLLLGSHPDVTGLGEIVQLLHKDASFVNRMCSCGSRMNNCAFWGPLTRELKSNRELDVQKKYDLVLRSFRESFGDGKILIDSSKGLPVLENLRSRDDVDLKVIHLVKDVRSWMVSRFRHRERNKDFNRSLAGRYGLWYPVVRVLTAMPVYYFRQWRQKNREAIDYLVENGLDACIVSYDLFAVNPAETLRRICDFIGISYDDSMLKPSNSQSHIVRGNNMRSKNERTRSVVYKTQWMTDRRWIIPSLLMPGVMNFNKRYVHTTAFTALNPLEKTRKTKESFDVTA